MHYSKVDSQDGNKENDSMETDLQEERDEMKIVLREVTKKRKEK